ncbi:hypothetical protein A6V39_03035 [Candidatus Mycoplasma haematobovis]|uniref:Uncharacterized protein n=1 Tax=Candidatus Mycoplasma haematobovis TaxID=432608 RepID=A0A1A9QEK1_9MOLU|nr:hypothetical protein A6V39_03035 [Candidatus Mycoplasma haematobovis]
MVGVLACIGGIIGGIIANEGVKKGQAVTQASSSTTVVNSGGEASGSSGSTGSSSSQALSSSTSQTSLSSLIL